MTSEFSALFHEFFLDELLKLVVNNYFLTVLTKKEGGGGRGHKIVKAAPFNMNRERNRRLRNPLS